MFAQTYGRLVVCLACIDIGKWLTWHCSSSHVHKRLKDRGFWGFMWISCWELQGKSRNQWHREGMPASRNTINYHSLRSLSWQNILNRCSTSNHINGTWLSCILGSHFVAPDPAVNIQERYTHTCRLLNISCLRNITLPMDIVPFDILGHLIFFGQIHIVVSSSGSCLLCIYLCNITGLASCILIIVNVCD